MKGYFRKCFACHSGYKCKKTQRLPRRLKKFYKKFLIENNKFFFRGWMDHATSCELASCFNLDRKLIQTLPMINKYRKELEMLFKYCEIHGETIYIMANGRLGWFWESDSDYGGSQGVMEFCYSKEEAGDTWAYSEVKSLIRWIVEPSTEIHNITSDRALLKLVRKYSKYRWVHFPSPECPICGSSSTEVYSKSNTEGFVYDGDAARCENCGHTGMVSVEDSELSLIHI